MRGRLIAELFWSALVATLLLAFGCSGKKEPAPPPAISDAAPAAPDYGKWKTAIAAERTRTYDRPPLFEPGTPGKSADDYLPAVVIDVPIEVYSAAEPVLSGRVAWKKAPLVVRDYATGPTARSVADAILRGASRSDGKSIAPLRSDILSVLEGNPDLITMLVALADADAGKIADGCRYLLALQRLAQDLARGAPLVADLVARTYQRNSARLLRDLVSRKGLPIADLRAVVSAYTRLVDTQVTLGASLDVEALFRAKRVLETPLPRGEPESSRTEALARIEIERRIATTIDRRRSLAERISYYETESCRGDLFDHACREGGKYLVAMALRDANFLATYLFVALELYRRERGKPAAELAVLAPEIIPRVPADPITGAPFEYLEIDGKMVIRRGTTSIEGDDIEPRDIPAPR